MPDWITNEKEKLTFEIKTVIIISERVTFEMETEGISEELHLNQNGLFLK